MTNESDIQTEQQAQSTSVESQPEDSNVVAFAPQVAQPVAAQKSNAQKRFEEMSAAIPQETREKINHTLAFLEAGMNQWEQVKDKGHSPKSFIESFIQVLTEYDGLRESGTDKRRAQMLTLMKIRGQIVEVAYADLKKKEQ